jgi:hypothetical protein
MYSDVLNVCQAMTFRFASPELKSNARIEIFTAFRCSQTCARFSENNLSLDQEREVSRTVQGRRTKCLARVRNRFVDGTPSEIQTIVIEEAEMEKGNV